MTGIHWTEVDNVVTIWTEAPSPLRAGIYFRTGQADESLTMAGHSHLIEHLAFSMVNDNVQRHNGFVTGAVTGFYTYGQPQEVSAFLANICEALTCLPGSRLENEKQILEAENAARSYNFISNLLLWRYGAKGYGQVGMAELGLHTATIEQLQNYSTQRFTRENAVLWFSGPPPTDLRLNLPHGMKYPVPRLEPIQPAFPCWFVDNACNGIAAGATVPRVSASTIFIQIATHRLRERLRTAQSVSYSPQMFYEPLNADTAHLVLYADSHKEHRKELASLFGEVIEGFGTIHTSEFETARQEILDHWTGALAPPPADQMLIDAPRAAMDWILGNEFESFEELAAELLLVTVRDVVEFGRDARATMMFALPGEAILNPWVGKEAPPSIGSAVHGRETRSIDAPIVKQRLVVGPDGVSLVWPNGQHITARYAELAAALYYDDGYVCLISAEGTYVPVEPTLWRNGKTICRKIYEQIPAHLLLAQGSRPADAIPRPTTTAWQRFRRLLF